MIEAKLSISKIEQDLRTMIKSVYNGEVFYHNRITLSNSKMNDFMVVKVNGQVSGTIATDEVISGGCLVMIELWARDRIGIKDTYKFISLRDQIIGLLPYKTEDYKIIYNSEVGSRDGIGFHAEFINLKLTVI